MKIYGMEPDLKGALKTIEETFGDHLKQNAAREKSSRDEALLSVLPRNVEEVELLAEVAERYSVPLVPLGAGSEGKKAGSILVRFDLMRGIKVRGKDEMWVRAEPGASWLELDEALGTRGWGMAVYPTSAPGLALAAGWPRTGSGWAPTATAGRARTSSRRTSCSPREA